MIPLLCALGLSLLLAVLLTPLACRLALRWGLIDHPDGRRKIHPRPMPLAGGVVVLVSSGTALAVGFALTPTWIEQLDAQSSGLIGLGIAALAICGLGLIDDCRGLRGHQKLLGQFLAVGIVMAGGVVVRRLRLFDWEVELGLLALPVTAFWLMGAINSLNLLDGMDGMLGCVGVSICLGLAAVAATGEQWITAAVAAGLGGALLGFLVFNLPPASLFLGDCGSMLVGLVIGVVAIQGSLQGPETVALVTPAALMVLPILDTLAAIVRRKLTGQSIYTADRGHLHHCLLRRGWSNGQVLLIVSFLCLLNVIGTLLSLRFHNESFAVGSALAVVLILLITGLFGNAELALLKQRLCGLAAVCRRGPPFGVAPQSEVRLQGAGGWATLWDSLIDCAAQRNFVSVCLDVNAPFLHDGYHARWNRSGEDAAVSNMWRAAVPLVVEGRLVGRLEVSGPRDQEPVGANLLRVAQLAEDVENEMLRLAVQRQTGAAVVAPPGSELGIEGFASYLALDRAVCS
ncbi:MAG: undecaprenyl/decaprenyl-phosphate alpha-N-acetylglucosaminyl 1-phosphate transferase [Gemmataceae bacterium]|nr:undecaprenyl/decaprenyl-phosphate alpha-N-acetylglucosaminyl 1-phosphate transferase [Gemmataceae bacterium]